MSVASHSQLNDYAVLKRLVASEGLLKPQNAYYVMKSLVATGLLAVAVGVAVTASSPFVLLLNAAFLGFVFTQVALLAHDVGHRQAFRGRRTSAIARAVLGNLVLGVSQSWWKTKHNRHHATPNHIDDDPDVQFPMIAFSPEQIATRPQWLRPVIAIQAFVFPFLLPFQAISMRLSGADHVFRGLFRGRGVEAALLGAHVAWYVALLALLPSWPIAVAFAAIHQASFGLYNSSVFASNHKGMPMVDAAHRADFLREQVLTSRNVRGHWLTDFWYGGLNYQVEHHLFPTLPRNNLRRVQPIVQRFCAERGIRYHATGLVESYREILGHLHEVSAPLRRRAVTAQ